MISKQWLVVRNIDEINDTRHFSALVELSFMRRTPLRGYRREEKVNSD